MIFMDEKGVISTEAPRVSLLDHGFLFGDSLYEVVRLYDSKLFAWAEHRDRLKKSASRMGISLDSILPLIETRLIEMFKKLGKPNAVCRIIVTRGEGKLHINPNTCTKPLVYLVCWPFDFSMVPDSVSLLVPRIRRNSKRSLDPAIKSGNYLNNVLALKEAIDAGFDDALMLNTDDQVTELTTSNIGWLRNGKIETPSVDAGILYGITRHYFMQSRKVEQGLFLEESLKQADQIFALSTLKEICPVSKIQFSDGSSKQFEPNQEIRELQRQFREEIDRKMSQETSIL